MVYFSDDNDDCKQTETLVFYIVQPFYIFLQLFMIFKYSNVRQAFKKKKQNQQY